jgi:hypothetical protein
MKAPIIPNNVGNQSSNFRRLEESIELDLDEQYVLFPPVSTGPRIRSESTLGNIEESEEEEDRVVNDVKAEEDPFEQFSSLTLIH